MMIDLTPDQLLTTTRAVRKRLDLTRPVERKTIEECIGIAQQAPSGSNIQGWHFVVVTDGGKRAKLAELFRKGAEPYLPLKGSPPLRKYDNPVRNATQKRILESVWYLVDHLHEVPVHVIPCVSGRTEGLSSARQAGVWGSIFPATWSFMLAARARGLGTTFTTFHLNHEEEAARLLGIPFRDVTQVGLVPVAYAKGTDFKPAPRDSLTRVIHWNGW